MKKLYQILLWSRRILGAQVFPLSNNQVINTNFLRRTAELTQRKKSREIEMEWVHRVPVAVCVVHNDSDSQANWTVMSPSPCPGRHCHNSLQSQVREINLLTFNLLLHYKYYLSDVYYTTTTTSTIFLISIITGILVKIKNTSLLFLGNI